MTAVPRERRPPTLDDPVDFAGVRLRNRLYRAPVLECAGNDDDAVDRLIADLEPAAAAGAGLIHQGATIVTGEGGCAAPGMTRVHDPDFVAGLARLTDAVHAHGSRIAIQLEHGGLRSMEVWHDAYGRANPDRHQLAVSRPPRVLRALDRLGFLDLSPRVMTTAEVESLVDDFARAAARAVDAGYDAIHIAGANMGIVQQFLSPFYNRREDRFGIDPAVGPDGTPGVGVAFLERLAEAIRDRAGDVPLLTKIPSERPTLPGIGPYLSDNDAVAACERLAGTEGPFDAVVPVRTSVFWDMSVVRGAFPASAWRDERFRDGFREAFGSLPRAAAVAAGNWIESFVYDREPGWNRDLCRRVRHRVDAPVLCEGGLRDRAQLDDALARDADLVGMARPFYAEPELPARLLGAGAEPEARAVCADCNNCAIAQAAGESGVCRTPAVLRAAGELRRQGAYDRNGAGDGRDAGTGDSL
ncbi:2,4-dienoyl-CoA reductase-like NADH-dependent reductase (Old Yellow Enzyme family) [Halorubrum alkaliphilum]|uniref:2,4-dienoyl-CoA reductase-like NADH-dependent reductase (Old Yellow Enzyme family) n=1 Tax=Halorubrum alkaliphilum TaxID=261290 RepID=A0A8T4GH72_9EURY|nr:NADH:flavin oxidoreductase [Halorubrum alkaliphilum]MBP1922512.1 2,4-dienoyl-CoA reductase-like NADH-dependent reductase (Old Yellow Enzyme family) [Halorubrum alkaliphilum]